MVARHSKSGTTSGGGEPKESRKQARTRKARNVENHSHAKYVGFGFLALFLAICIGVFLRVRSLPPLPPRPSPGAFAGQNQHMSEPQSITIDKNGDTVTTSMGGEEKADDGRFAEFEGDPDELIVPDDEYDGYDDED